MSTRIMQVRLDMQVAQLHEALTLLKASKGMCGGVALRRVPRLTQILNDVLTNAYDPMRSQEKQSPMFSCTHLYI